MPRQSKKVSDSESAVSAAPSSKNPAAALLDPAPAPAPVPAPSRRIGRKAVVKAIPEPAVMEAAVADVPVAEIAAVSDLLDGVILRPRTNTAPPAEPVQVAADVPFLNGVVQFRTRPASSPRGSERPAAPLRQQRSRRSTEEVSIPVLDPEEFAAIGMGVPIFRPRRTDFDSIILDEGDAADGQERRRGTRERRNGIKEMIRLPGEPPKPVTPEVKPLIPTPEDAPQIIQRNGRPLLVQAGEVISPLALDVDLANASRPDEVTAQIRRAAEAGVHLILSGFAFSGREEAASEEANEILTALQTIRAADPDARVLIRLNLTAARGWETAFPNGVYKSREGKLAPPSITDDAYWSSVHSGLSALLTKLTDAEGLIGIQLDRDGWAINGGYDSSPGVHAAFRRWLRERYMNDEVMLRAAWFDGNADFERSEAVTRSISGREGAVRLLRRDRRERRAVDTHLFLSDLTVARIADLAYVAKETSGGRLLVGVRYGDTFEDVTPGRGQLSLGKLLRTPEVDFISLPPASTGAPQAAVDSIALNGKLFLSEGDYRTSLGSASGDREAVRSPQELESLHLRDLGFAQSHGGGTIWTDRGGKGSLDTASVWRRAVTVREGLDLTMAAEPRDPDVAVFLDERALAYLDDAAAFGSVVRGVRDATVGAGVSVGFYLLSDLAHRERFPESRVSIFLNAWDVRADLRSAIKTRLQKDGKVLLWLYAAGLFDGGREAIERVRDITGIALRPQPFASKSGTTVLDRRHPFSASFGDAFEAWPALDPSFSGIPEDGLVLGEYKETGLPSFIARRIGAEDGSEWTSVFLGDPVITAGLIRALVEAGGGHVWSYGEDEVVVKPPFLTLRARGLGQRAVTLPLRWSAYDLGQDALASVEGNTLRMSLADGTIARLLVGPREEIEQMRTADLAALRKVDRIPPRESNERVDVSNFEAPIVRLDAFSGDLAEEGEIVDEWFLRPAAADPGRIELTATDGDSGERSGRRRNRRGREGGSSYPARAVDAQEAAEDALNMNVVFRSRA